MSDEKLTEEQAGALRLIRAFGFPRILWENVSAKPAWIAVHHEHLAMAEESRPKIDVDALAKVIGEAFKWSPLSAQDPGTWKRAAMDSIAHFGAQPAKPTDGGEVASVETYTLEQVARRLRDADMCRTGTEVGLPLGDKLNENADGYRRMAAEALKCSFSFVRHRTDDLIRERDEARERAEKAEFSILGTRNVLETCLGKDERSCPWLHDLAHVVVLRLGSERDEAREACADFAAVAQMLPERAFTDEITTLPDAVRALIEQGDAARNELAQVREKLSRRTALLHERVTNAGGAWVARARAELASDSARETAPAVAATKAEVQGLPRVGDMVEFWMQGWARSRVKSVNDVLGEFCAENGVSGRLGEEGKYWRRVQPAKQTAEAPRVVTGIDRGSPNGDQAALVDAVVAPDSTVTIVREMRGKEAEEEIARREKAQAWQEVTTEHLGLACRYGVAMVANSHDERTTWLDEKEALDCARDDIRANVARAVAAEANRCQVILSENEAKWQQRVRALESQLEAGAAAHLCEPLTEREMSAVLNEIPVRTSLDIGARMIAAAQRRKCGAGK
jgi:hypothetical protein